MTPPPQSIKPKGKIGKCQTCGAPAIFDNIWHYVRLKHKNETLLEQIIVEAKRQRKNNSDKGELNILNWIIGYEEKISP